MADPVKNHLSLNPTRLEPLPNPLEQPQQVSQSSAHVAAAALPVLEQTSSASHTNQSPLSPNQVSSSTQPQIAAATVQRPRQNPSSQPAAASSKAPKKGKIGQAVTYAKIGFCACVAPDVIKVAESLVEEPTFSQTCVASVKAMSESNIVSKVGGAVFLAPSVARRVIFGTQWEQAATIAAGLTACYCTGGALVPTLLFAEGAGLFAEVADKTSSAISHGLKKTKIACTNALSHVAHRVSIRQTFQNFSDLLRTRRVEERAQEREQRLNEIRFGEKKEKEPIAAPEKPQDGSEAPKS